MNNKKTTFHILDNLPDNYTFTGYNIRDAVTAQTHKPVYIATILRYMRIWRRSNRQIKCINKSQSKYIIRGDNANTEQINPQTLASR